MYAEYKKLGSSWGIQIHGTISQDGSPFAPGQIVLVNKANGALKTERLGSIVSVGKKYTLAEIDRKSVSTAATTSDPFEGFLSFDELEEENAVALMMLQWSIDDLGAPDAANELADDYRRAMRAKAEANRVPVTEFGMYKTADGTIYKVQPARTSGNMYAKKLVRDGDGFKFEYASGAINLISASDRMTLEQAQEFGRQFNFCCVCAALLTDLKSVAAGIGPICAKRV